MARFMPLLLLDGTLYASTLLDGTLYAISQLDGMLYARTSQLDAQFANCEE